MLYIHNIYIYAYNYGTYVIITIYAYNVYACVCVCVSMYMYAEDLGLGGQRKRLSTTHRNSINYSNILHQFFVLAPPTPGDLVRAKWHRLTQWYTP